MMKNIKNIGRRNNIKKFIYLIIFSIILIYPFTTPILAQVDNHLVQVDIAQEEIVFKEFKYTNDTDKPVKYKIEIRAYDAETETFLNTKPFITSQISEFELKPKATKNIKYVIAVDNKITPGTYFNVIGIIPDTKTSDIGSSVGIKNGLGILVVINVTNSDTTIARIYQKQSSTQLILENPGFPFIYPMKIKYNYKNESNYVFTPIGEIRILDDNQKQVTGRYEINPNENRMYPKQGIDIEWEIDTWKDINQILKGKTIIARSYYDKDDVYIEDQIKVNILPHVIVLIALIILVLIFINSGIVFLLKKLYNKKNNKERVILKDQIKENSIIEK